MRRHMLILDVTVVPIWGLGSKRSLKWGNYDIHILYYVEINKTLQKRTEIPYDTRGIALI